METLSINNTSEEKQLKERVAKWMLWLSIVSMIMIFAGLTSAYVVRQNHINWLVFDLPPMFYVSSAVILVSSVTMNIALSSAKKNNYKAVTYALLATLALGIAFVFTQFAAWDQLIANNIVFAGKFSNASGSFLYVLTGLHLAHLAGGLLSVFYTLIRSLKHKYNAENLLGLKLCSIFWHFLDALWIYLFLFLLIIR